MIRLALTYALAVLFCATLFFSCTSDLEMPPPPDEQGNSSNDAPPPLSLPNETSSSSEAKTKPPPISQPSEQSSSSELGSGYESSSSQSTTQSSTDGGETSSSSKPPSTASGGCIENNPKSGFTCSWNKTTNLTPGFVLKPTEPTGKGDCEIVWNYAYGDQKPLSSDDVRFNCYALENEGLVAEGSRTYALFANLTCSDGKYINACTPEISSGIAPYLNGECVWLSPVNDSPLPSNETSVGKGAKPSGVTLVDPDKICASNAIAAKFENGIKPWSNSPEPDIYTDVQYVATNCPAYDVVPVICPPLKVKATSPDEVICVYPVNSGTLSCTLNGKTMSSGLLDNKLSNASEGCMDIEVDWQNTAYPGTSGSTLNIYVQCTYTGSQANKTCKVTYNGKESNGTNQTTSNSRCDSQYGFSIGTVKGVSNQFFPKVCMNVIEGGDIKDTNISCSIQVY